MLALRLCLAQRLAQVADIRNGLAANFENDVAGLKALLGGWTIWLDRAHDDALLACASYFTRWRHLQPEVRHATGWLGVVVFGACPSFVWHLRQCHRDTPRLAFPNDVEFDRRLGRHRADAAREVASILHLCAIDSSDHIAGFDPGLRSGAAALRLVDHRACCLLQAEAVGDIGGHWLDLHAKPPPRDTALLLELRHDHLGSVGRNVEANPDRAARR